MGGPQKGLASGSVNLDPGSVFGKGLFLVSSRLGQMVPRGLEYPGTSQFNTSLGKGGHSATRGLGTTRCSGGASVRSSGYARADHGLSDGRSRKIS
eukprot:5816425-Pyramimonas_sp.AAC.1